MNEWIVENTLATAEELADIQDEAREHVKIGKQKAWEKYINPIKEQVAKTVQLLNAAEIKNDEVKNIIKELTINREPMRRDVLKALAKTLDIAGAEDTTLIKNYYKELRQI